MEGHPQAPIYPLACLWNEAEFARLRRNAFLRSHAMATYAAVMQAQVGGDILQKLLKELSDG